MSYFDDNEDRIVYGRIPRDPAPRKVMCHHCQKTGLWWFPEKRGVYRLMNADGTQHNCQRGPASPDEFPEVKE